MILNLVECDNIFEVELGNTLLESFSIRHKSHTSVHSAPSQFIAHCTIGLRNKISGLGVAVRV